MNISKAAYGDKTLGLPKICLEENVEEITRDHIVKYLQQYHTPDRMVLAG